MALEDFQAVRELRRRQDRLFHDIAAAVPQKKIVIYSMDPWQLGAFEQFLHLAFQLKGHVVRTIRYDSLLPITAWENSAVPPPDPAVLQRRFDYVHGAFGIESVGLSAYLDAPAVRQAAEKFVQAQPAQVLPTLHYRGQPIGQLALRDLHQYTLSCFEPETPEDLALYRRHLIQAVLSVDLARAILARERPDIVVLVNGKTVMYTYMYEVARQAGVQVTTWEEGMYWDTAVMVANNARAIDFPIDEKEWTAYQERYLPPEELERVHRHFQRWRAQIGTGYVYYDREIGDFARIAAELHLPPDARLIVALANIVWDSNALGRDQAFAGMMDWIYTTVDLLRNRADCVLVIRAHPGEARWAYPTRTTVRQLLHRRYGTLPTNVRIVDGRSELSSYELARRADVCAVYTSTIGMELTLMGLQPLVCGVPFYSRRGATNDIATKTDYARFILGDQVPTAAQSERMARFMHLVLYGRLKRPEFFVGMHRTPQEPRIRIETFEGWPGSMPVFNQVVEDILAGGSFVPADEHAPLPAQGAA